jgi:pilus assembly protein CpaE
MLTAAVVSKDLKSSAALQASLQQTGLVTSAVRWEVNPERHPAPGEPVPDVVLLDLTEDPEPFLEFAAHVRRHRPAAHIIACSNLIQPDPEFLLHAMRTGVRDFLTKPVSGETLQTTLSAFTRERGGDAEGFKKLIVVMGAKGGVGTTTVAVNLGVQLAQMTKKRVGLLDFGCPFGQVSLLLDLQPRFSLRDAIDNMERLDGHFFSGLLTQHKSGLEVLAGTSHPDEWSRITVPSLVRLVNVAQGAFDFVIADYGSMYSSEARAVLSLARAVVMITQADVPSLWALGRHIPALSEMGIDAKRIRIVANRWHKRDEEALASVEKNLKRPISSHLPNDFKQVSAATNLGAPLNGKQHDPLAVAMRNLARQVAGIAPDEDKTAARDHRFSFRLKEVTD